MAPDPGNTSTPTVLSDATDRDLHAAMARGDESAFAEIYRRHATIAYTITVRVLRDAASAEEVVQDCFVGLWDHPERFDPDKGELRPYLVRTAHSRAIDRVRSETRRSAREERHERENPGREADIEREVWQIVRAEIVRDAMETLSPGERDALQLAYFKGLSYREVAAVSGVAEGTVKGRIRAALAKLGDRLDSAGLERAK